MENWILDRLFESEMSLFYIKHASFVFKQKKIDWSNLDPPPAFLMKNWTLDRHKNVMRQILNKS